MAQRPSIAEELAENIRCLQASVEAACEDGLISAGERTALRREFVSTKAQVRLVVSAQAAGLRFMRTGHIDKNQGTDLRAIAACSSEGTGRLLQFTAPQAQRRASGGREPDDIA